jgi:predicted aspartyl protease
MPLLHRIPADLADDSTVELDVHFATVVWHGQERLVRVIATGRRPLLGTALLDESKLSIKFREGGQVTVQAL